MNRNKSVMVTDGFWRKSLAVVRALSKRGLKVGVGERTILAPALFSRYADLRYIYPSVSLYPDKFILWLEKLVKSRKFDVLLTPEEETCLLISQYKERLSRFIRIPIVEFDAINFVSNKSSLISHAERLGIPCPKTSLVRSVQDIYEYKQNFQFPLVLKPIKGSGSNGIRYVFSNNELESVSNEVLGTYKEFLMQDYIPGSNYYGVSLIFNERHEMRTAFVHQKLRQYPSTGGASTYAVSVKFPELIELAETLLKSLKWYGVANVEFKVDQRDNVPKLMEVNPRLWGSLQLAISSGLNIPYMLYQLALEGDIKPLFSYKTGVKFKWFLHGDAMYLLSNLHKLRKDDLTVLKLYEKGSCHAIWSLSDPLPTLGNILSFYDFLTSKELRKYHG